MNLQDLQKHKQDTKLKILDALGLPKRAKMLLALDIQDEKIEKKLQKAFSILPVNCIVRKVEGESQNIKSMGKGGFHDMIGFDAYITDTHFEKIQEIMKLGIVPIVPTNHYMKSLLQEFSVNSATGNCYLYEGENEWTIFYATIRFLENAKFSYDHRNLVKNVADL